MPKINRVEKKIFEIEGFEVCITQNGRDVRSDASLPKQYEAERMTRNSFSVSEFRNKFKHQFAGYDIDVLKANGSKASGQTKLSTVRDTYIDEE